MSLNKLIKLQFNGEFKEIYLDTLEDILKINMIKNKTSFRDEYPFQLWVNDRIIIQSSSLNNFSRLYQSFSQNSIYFNSESVFKLTVQVGQINLFKL